MDLSPSPSRDSGYENDLETMLADIAVSTDKEENSMTDQDPHSKREIWPRPNEDFIAELAKTFRIGLVCRQCGEKGDPMEFVLCGGCGAAYMPAHRRCLLSSPMHKPEQDGSISYGAPCEEVDLPQFIYTMWLLDSRLIDKHKASLHADDLWSTWFGVPSQQEGCFPQLHIYPRLEHLIDTGPDRPPRQYPSLISCVGDTGSGKSTLIRAMIRMVAPRSHQEFRVPIPGAASDGFDSTSSDVHLFSDPGSIQTEVPLFFVDCEGFSGTDTPVSKRLLSNARQPLAAPATKDGTTRNPSPADRPTKDILAEHANTATNRIELKWGQVLAPVDASKGIGRKPLGQVDVNSRNIVVKTVYPRLLYAFSDVVCFSTNNSRASQNILEQMFKWAKDGHDRTFNQRVRPGLIIILNKMPSDSHDSLSSVTEATRRLLESFQESTRFEELQKKWKARGRVISTAEELILCYYESFRVISIPQYNPSSPAAVKQVSEQIKVLYNEILSMSKRIRQRKRSLNMDLDVSSLSAYLRRSVAALGNDFHNSLDFHQLSDGLSALPRRFSEHLVQLMSRMVKLRHFDTSQAIGGEAELVTQMSSYIAACIVAQIDESDNPESIQKRKELLVEEARRGLECFRDRFWRCEAKDSTGQRRCKNYWEGHDKGHQFDDTMNFSPDGSNENIEVGLYQSSYDPDGFTDQVWEALSNIRSRARSMEKLASAATTCGVIGVTTQRTCLSCLSNTPTNMLPCRPQQHGICQDCIRRYSKTSEQESLIQISSCPLGCSLTYTPWSIRVKPRTAGARILSLDGGGIRGIIEVTILDEIERAVGQGLRIQELFDLVIGTSTGGLVALGVFENNWSLNEADRYFNSLLKEAFSARRLIAVPVLSKVAEPFMTHKYKTAGINNTLQTNFGKNFLFGQTELLQSTGDRVKVGVVTCLEGQNQPCLIANYSRNPSDKLKDGREGYDCLQREDEQKKDFLTWQAARATSAAQTLYKPYIHPPTYRTYVDGATVRNNPVRLAYEEGMRIWKSSKPPDIILSLGTGILVDKDGKVTSKRNAHMESIKNVLPKGFKKKVETGLDMVQATLDCHREWVDFSGAFRGRLGHNCHRLDVGLTVKPPALDAIKEASSLRTACQKYLQSNPNKQDKAVPYFQPEYSNARSHIRSIARRLLASLFYLGHDLTRDMIRGTLESTLYCRLSPHSDGAPALISNTHGPVFRIREVNDRNEEVVRPIQLPQERRFDPKTMSTPVEIEISGGPYERFVEVQFRQWKHHWEPIGGF